jgi:hypothetical protein
MSDPKVELLITWDSDGGGTLRMFVNGVETAGYAEEWVDPGRGHMLSEWRGHNREVEADEDYSPAFKEAVLAARDEAEKSSYVEDDREAPVDLAWELITDDDRVGLWQDYVNLDEAEKDRLDTFACEQVSRMLVSKLVENHHDAWLIHGTDPDEADGLVDDHWWVGVDDGGATLNIDLTAQQFLNVAGHENAEARFEWPLTWHTSVGGPVNDHQVIKYRTFTVEPARDAQG